MIRPPLGGIPAAGMAGGAQALSPRSALLPRSDSTPLSPGAIAGAVIGSVVGAVLVLVCAFPFIVRARRRVRGDEAPFSLQAEMEAAATAATAAADRQDHTPSSPMAPARATIRRLSVDHFAPSGSQDSSQPVKDFDLSGTHQFESEPRVYYNNAAAPSPVWAQGTPPLGVGYPAADNQQGQQTQQPPLVPGSPLDHYAPDGVERTGTFKTEDTGTTIAPAAPARPRSTRSSISNAIKSAAAAVFRRTSTRSLSSQGLGSPMHSPSLPNDPTISPPPPATFSPVDNMPPLVGEAASYYSGAPMSPPMSVYSPLPPQPLPMTTQMGVTADGSSAPQPLEIQTANMRQQQQFFPPLDISPRSPTSPGTSPQIKEEVASEDEDAFMPPAAKSVKKRMLTFLKQSPPPMPMSPTQAGPGTINLMHIQKPTNADERSWMVQTELIKIENSPPPPRLLDYASSPESDEKQPETSQHHQYQHQQPVTPNTGAVLDYASPVSMPGDTSMDDFLNLESPVGAPAQARNPHPKPNLNQTVSQDQFQPQPQKTPYQTQQFQTPPPQLHPEVQSYIGNFQQTYPHTPTYIKVEPDPNQLQMQTPGLYVPGPWTPNPGSLTSGPSGQDTPDTRFTGQGSNYTGSESPPSNGGHTTGNFPAGEEVPKGYKCEQCSRVFDQVHKLNHHRRYHERPHECAHEDCGKRFGTKTHLDRHINDKHNKTRKYRCTVDGCPFSRTGDRAFPRKDNWRRHMQNKHGLNPAHDPPEVNDEEMTDR